MLRRPDQRFPWCIPKKVRCQKPRNEAVARTHGVDNFGFHYALAMDLIADPEYGTSIAKGHTSYFDPHIGGLLKQVTDL